VKAQTVLLIGEFLAAGTPTGGHYNPDQPRAPQGTDIGGRWIAAGGAGSPTLEERRRPTATPGQLPFDFAASPPPDDPSRLLLAPDVPGPDYGWQPPDGYVVKSTSSKTFTEIPPSNRWRVFTTRPDEPNPQYREFGDERHAQWWVDLQAGRITTASDDFISTNFMGGEITVTHRDGSLAHFETQDAAWADWRAHQRAAGRLAPDPPPRGVWGSVGLESLSASEVRDLRPEHNVVIREQRTGALRGYATDRGASEAIADLTRTDTWQRVGRPSENIPEPARRRLDAQLRGIEKDTVGYGDEFATGFTVTGAKHYVLPGNASSVTIPDAVSAPTAGGVLTHNHPSGSSLSAADIVVAQEAGLREIVAFGDYEDRDFNASGVQALLGGRRAWRYTMRFGAGTERLPASVVKAEAERLQDEQVARGLGRVQAGEWSPELAYAAHGREMWPRFVQRMREKYAAEFEYREEAL